MADPVLEARGLTRYFGRKCAVNDLKITVERGCVFGFLGRNGSGKTTTIRMLLGLLEPTRGSCSILGHDSADLPPEVRARIGYLAEGHNLYGWMRVRECGEFQASFFKQWNHDVFRAVTEYFQLDPGARAGSLSKGERAGLCLALTLAPEPELLILDDPALGLDPVARRALLEAMVYVTRRQDRTVFFSSHLLSDVERVADRIAVLDRGQLRACCGLEFFREHVRRFVLRFPYHPPELPSIPGLLDSARTENEVAVTFVGDDGGAVEERLRGLGARQIEEAPIDLEEAFISYVGNRGSRSFLLPASGGPS
ncbi:MAG: ABC transporter ATP-binding protein [Phycisphaerae bacterium]|nr:ABC transporter ATP-binding protein [Phycisphaerae bacterium]